MGFVADGANMRAPLTAGISDAVPVSTGNGWGLAAGDARWMLIGCDSLPPPPKSAVIWWRGDAFGEDDCSTFAAAVSCCNVISCCFWPVGVGGVRSACDDARSTARGGGLVDSPGCPMAPAWVWTRLNVTGFDPPPLPLDMSWSGGPDCVDCCTNEMVKGFARWPDCTRGDDASLTMTLGPLILDVDAEMKVGGNAALPFGLDGTDWLNVKLVAAGLEGIGTKRLTPPLVAAEETTRGTGVMNNGDSTELTTAVDAAAGRSKTSTPGGPATVGDWFKAIGKPEIFPGWTESDSDNFCVSSLSF